MSRSALDRSRGGSSSSDGLPPLSSAMMMRTRRANSQRTDSGVSLRSSDEETWGSPTSSAAQSFSEKVGGLGERVLTKAKQKRTDILEKPITKKLVNFWRSAKATELPQIPEVAPPSPSHSQSTTTHPTMDFTHLAPGARMQADDRDRKRRIEDAKEMAQKVTSNAERANREPPPYEFLELIGKGAFGRVYKCRYTKTGELVAVKITNVDEQDWNKRNDNPEDTILDFKKEVSTLQQLKDNSVKNVNIIHDAFDIFDQLWIVADYCTGGSVRTLMRPLQKGLQTNGLDEEYIIPIARELATAIKGIHDLDIVHRDIKCANVYITETGDIQLGDFGIVASIDDGNYKRKTVIGTPHYMSIELFEADQDNGGYGTEVDIWAYGCTLYEMATGVPPLHMTGVKQLANRIREAPPRLEDTRYSENLRDLINTCLTVDSKTRPNIDTVLKHPAIANTSRKYPTSKLVELIAKFKFWEHGGGSRASLWIQGPNDPTSRISHDEDDDDSESALNESDGWNFSTSEAFDRRISQLPDLDSTDLSYLHAPAGAGLPPDELPPLQTQDLSIAERIRQEHQERTENRGWDALAPIFDQTRPNGYQMTPVEEPNPARPSDLPLRNFTSDAPTRESMIEIDLDQADVNASATSTFALHMDALNEDTVKPAGRRMAPEEDDDDDYTYSQTNDTAADKRATMEWTFPQTAQPKPQTAQPKRGTMDWTFSTAEPAQPDEAEASMSIPPVGFDGELAPGFRPTLRHTSTEPLGHFRDYSHDMRSAITSPDRSSVTSMIDLDLGLVDPVRLEDDPAEIVRPMTASSAAGSTMTDMTSGNPFDLEDDPVQNELDRNRFSYHKQWRSDGGTLKRLSHKTMQMHARGSSLSSTDSETAMRQNTYPTQTPSMGYDIGQGLEFSDDTNQFPNFSTGFDSFGSNSGYLQANADVPRLGDSNFPLEPALHSNGISSRSREPSSEPTAPEVEFPMIEPPHPDALTENADPQLLADELDRFLDDASMSLNSVSQALRRYARIDEEEEDHFNPDIEAGFDSNREGGAEYDSSSDYPSSSRRARSRQQSSPRLPQNDSFT